MRLTRFRFRVLALVLALAAAPMFVACAKKAPNVDPQTARQQQVLKVLHAVQQIGIVVEQVQLQEGQLAAAGDIPAATHAAIVKVFAETSSAVLTATQTLQAATETTDPKVVVQAVADGLKSLAQTFAHLNAKQAQQLSGWLDTASALVELAVS